MAISWAYGLDNDKSIIQDFIPAQSGDTIATQTNGTAGAYTAKKGDVVSLNDQGRVCLAKNAVPSGKTNPYLEGTAILGVCEGGNFLGLAQGGTYAAVTASNNHDSVALAKVHTSDSDVYRVDLISGGATPVVGTKYSLTIDPVHGVMLDPSNPSGATTIFQVIEWDSDKNQAFGVFTALEIA